MGGFCRFLIVLRHCIDDVATAALILFYSRATDRHLTDFCAPSCSLAGRWPLFFPGSPLFFRMVFH